VTGSLAAAPALRAFAALGTTAVVIVDGDPRDADEAQRLLAAWLGRVDRALSRFRPDSDLVRANERAGRPTRVDPLLVEAAAAGLAAAQATGGLVHPLLGGALRAAGYDRTFELVAGRTVRVRPAPRTVPWRQLVVDAAASTIVVPPGAELDLGSTGKAWAADRAAAAIAAAVGAGVLVSLGGDVAVAGPAPGDGWPVRIADDHAAPLDGAGPVVAIAGGGLATSGTSVRRWRTTAGPAHHVLDPRTGRPADTPWRTATVAAATCVDANAAATAALVLGRRAPRWLAEHGLPARLAAPGRVVAVGGWPVEEQAA
jgi:thiamine biosynthesis lipoprotein